MTVTQSGTPFRQRTRTVGLLLGLMSAVTSCTGTDTTPDTIHPTPANVRSRESLTHQISQRENETGSPRLRELASALKSPRRRLEIGAPGAQSPVVFSRIHDVAIDHAGRTFVLDKSMSLVRVFDENGMLLDEFTGTDHMKLQVPEALDLTATGVIVSDRNTTKQRLKMFEKIDGVYRATRTIMSTLTADDLCVLGPNVYVRGVFPDLTSPGLIHTYTLAGASVGSFARPYQAENLIARVQMSKGRIACVPESNAILALSDRLPYLTAYSPGGHELWVSELTTFQLPRIVEGNSDRGRYFHITRRATFDIPASLIPLVNGVVLLQIARVEPGETDLPPMQSYLVESSTGEGLYLGTDLPLIYASQWPRLMAVETKPYAKLVEYAASGAIATKSALAGGRPAVLRGVPHQSRD